MRRTRRRFAGIYWNSLLSTLGAAFVVTGAALAGIINVHPWFAPQYAIPMLGMVLGNLLTGVSLALDRFMQGVARESGVIEGDLALGATRWEAARPLIGEAPRTGMIPTINAMMVMGVVSLPGMMTGQMLAGAAPDGSRTLPDRDHVHDRRHHRTGNTGSDLAGVPDAVQSPPSVVRRAAGDHRAD